MLKKMWSFLQRWREEGVFQGSVAVIGMGWCCGKEMRVWWMYCWCRMIKRNALRWIGHMERKESGRVVKREYRGDNYGRGKVPRII